MELRSSDSDCSYEAETENEQEEITERQLSENDDSDGLTLRYIPGIINQLVCS